MAKYLTTDTLIDSVKRRAMIPETQQTFQESDFLAFANEEMDLGCIPHVLSFHEEYFARTDLVDMVANVSRYQIPERAVGGKLRELAYQDSSGNIFEMSRIKVDDIPSYQNNVIQNSFTLFYVEGSEICLVPVTGIFLLENYDLLINFVPMKWLLRIKYLLLPISIQQLE